MADKTSAKQPTASDMKNWYEQNKARFDQSEDALTKLRDVTKSTTFRTISNFNKEDLRTYLKNITSNEVNLRNLSRYLYYRSQVYYRLISYNANMFDLNIRSVIPPYSLVDKNNDDDIRNSYYNTLIAMDKMNPQYEFLKAYLTCFREDVFYGCAYFNPESESSTSFFILPLDPDYCKITGVWETSDFSYAMNMTYFNKNKTLLEYWGEPFQSMYSEYESTGQKWVTMPPEYSVCLKAHGEDWETVVPPYSGLLNSLINLLDLEDIQNIQDEQSIYKLIWMEMETFNSDTPNDFKVDPSVSIPYWNRMVDEALPSYTSSAIVPGKLNAISFPDDASTDTNKVEKATETVLNTSGGAQILNSASISGTTAFNAAIRADTEFALSMLIPQTQATINRLLSYHIDNPSFVKLFEVSVYTRDAFKESILKDNTYGLAPKLLVNSLNGFSEMETLSLNYLENTILGLTDLFIPVKSSHTQSSSDSEAGGQVKTTSGGAGSITDDGEASQDKRDNTNG